MFDEWCEIDESEPDDRKTLVLLNERDGGRAAVKDELVERVRSHYDDLERIAEDVERLGFPGAATILRERMPRRPRARSAELGEILATEFIEFQTDFRIPVRRLRYKDGREMALRGDDYLGLRVDEEDRLAFLKGEAKSGRRVTRPIIADARERLSEDDGRPTPISLLFVADRLLEGNEEEEELGRRLRDEVARRSVPARRIMHGIFALSGNAPEEALEEDLDAADAAHGHISMSLHIEDHQAFVAEIYEEAADLGDD